MTAPRPQSIPVFLVVKSAFQVLWQQRDDALRLGFIPTLICFATLVYSQSTMTRSCSRFRRAGATRFHPAISFIVIVSALISLLSLAVLVANWLRFALLASMAARRASPDIGFGSMSVSSCRASRCSSCRSSP